jgi:hypothetical protein
VELTQNRQQEDGGDCIMISFIVSVLHKMILGSLNHDRCDEWNT